MKKVFYIALITIVSIFTTLNLSAQKEDKMPFETIGVGTSIGSFGAFGGHMAYSLDRNLHVGAKLGFYFDGGTDKIESTTKFVFAPYAKYFLTNIQYLNPFLQGSFLVNTFKEPYLDFTGITKTRTATATSLVIHAGAEWFPYNGVGVMAGIQLLQFDLDPTRFYAGIGETYIGIEWFLK